MNLSIFIARRYLFSKKKQNAINIISIISMVGVAIGTTALIVVLSVFNGIDTLLTSDEVLPAVLWWSIGGYVRLIENGYKFSEIDEDKDLEYEFAIESNHVIEFLNEFDWVDNGMTLTSMRANRVYEIYKEWCDECRYRVSGRNTFYKNLKGAITYFDGTETPHCELKSIRKQWFLVKK